MKTKSEFVNQVIGNLVETTNTIKQLEMPAHLVVREIQDACVYWLYKINQIDPEDHATCVGTIELTETLYNIICAGQLLQDTTNINKLLEYVNTAIDKLVKIYS